MRWALAAVLFPGLAFAETPPGEVDAASALAAEAAFESSLKWQTGDVELGDGIARLQLGDVFRFIGPEDAIRVIVDAWGNPPQEEAPLGMLFPVEQGPFSPDGFGVVIRFEQDGHVSDVDAAEIDYDAMLVELQGSASASNAERLKDGYPPIEIIGWATRPYYDAATHKLYWAKDLRFGDDASERTLNYDIRVLGRRGVLVMQAVSSIDQLESLQTRMKDVLARVEFNPGHRYEDFDSNADQVAAYGVGGLVAGGLLAKAGFFKVLLGLLIASKKFVVIGAVALVAVLYNYVRGRRETT
jgi:uncharacterized membrane-anchored protein